MSTSSDIWIAGTAAAFAVDLIVYPLDTVKTRLQSPDYQKLYTHAATGTVNRRALFRGLYQGVASTLLATLPAAGAFFTTYEHAKALYPRLVPALHSGHDRPVIPLPILHAAASATAELVSCAILTPAEVLKQNAQMVSGSAGAMRQTINKFRQQPTALWRGYTALAGRNLPTTALQFPLYERFRAGLRVWRDKQVAGDRQRRDGEISTLENGLITAVAAGAAGSIAAVVTTPVDVVKTRIMLTAAEEGEKGERRGSWKVGREIFEKEGLRGLMRGGALRGVWTMMGSGLYLGVYESGKSFLKQRREGHAAED